MNSLKSICIVRLSAMGDVLMMVPMVRAIQSTYPHAKITWIISNPAYQCVEGLSGVNFIVIEKPKTIIDYFRLWQKLRVDSYDVLLAPQASLRANLMYPLIKAKRKIGYDNKRARDLHRYFVTEQVPFQQEHTLDGFMAFAKAIDAVATYQWDIPLSEEEKAFAFKYVTKKPLLLINPVASKPERSWTVDGYVSVISQLIQKMDIDIILIGGPSQYDKDFAIQIKSGVKVLTGCDLSDLVGQTKPKQLMALIQNATLLLCPDTGPSHMATAMGTPVIALHAVTNPDISGPYFYREYVINHYPKNSPWMKQWREDNLMQTISPEEVYIQVQCLLTHLSTKNVDKSLASDI